MIIATDYPLLDIFWTMLIFFGWVIWFVILFRIFGDIFRREDASGWVKAAWIVFTILLPFIGVLIYLIVNGKGMTERALESAKLAQAQTDQYVRSVAGSGGPAAEIEKAHQLQVSGAITQAEFEALKAKALG